MQHLHQSNSTLSRTHNAIDIFEHTQNDIAAIHHDVRAQKKEDSYDLFFFLQTSPSNSSGSDLIMLLVNYGNWYKSQSITQGTLGRC